MPKKIGVLKSLKKGLKGLKKGLKKFSPKSLRKKQQENSNNLTQKSPLNILQNQYNKLSRKKTNLALEYVNLQATPNSNSVSNSNSVLTKENKKRLKAKSKKRKLTTRGPLIQKEGKILNQLMNKIQKEMKKYKPKPTQAWK